MKKYWISFNLFESSNVGMMTSVKQYFNSIEEAVQFLSTFEFKEDIQNVMIIDNITRLKASRYILEK